MSRFRIRSRLRMAAHALFIDTPLLPRRKPPASAGDGAGTWRTPCPSGPIEGLSACPTCGGTPRTLVCEYNRFILMDAPPDRAAVRYDYCLCHHCGVVYAAARPAGERYRWLLEHFEETLGRGSRQPGSAGKLTLSSFTLSDDEREELRRRARRGVFVSDHLGLSRKEYLPGLLSDRLANSLHAELLGSLLALRAPRVLEIRSRAGAIGASLQRLYGADVSVMALFENQRFMIEEVYGFAADGLLDYDAFTIPYAGQFDLIVANHMLTHVVRPRDFLATIRGRLKPGGHLYLYNEVDEDDYLSEGKSMFGTLNAFHLQAFDHPSLTRALAANGFAVTFLTRHAGTFLCLSRVEQEPVDWMPMDTRELERRRARYSQARDAAILMLPPDARARLGAEADHAIDRALVSGLAELDTQGRPRLRRRPPAP
jgi:SAM-dependent methyltransferase